jgi:protease-4
LLDAILYQDEIYALLKKKVNKANADKLSLVNFEQYARRKFKESKTLDGAKDANIAVVLAQGAIDTNGDGIASNSLVKQLREAREDKNIKAIVFRVNSPGGSALASEEIWREVSLANELKTVVVSMGDVAASGGYYISSPAKRIFAEPTTITGSIGVFGVIPYTGKMLEEKLGLTFDRASTNTHSVMTTNRKLTDKEFAVIQSEVNKIYTEFVDVVAKGRSLTPERVNQIARGRVWTGVDALEIGLVDELGGLNEAIQYAIKDANIEKPTFIYYPKTKKDGLMEILEMIAEQQEDEASASETLTGEAFKLMQQLKELDQIRGVQMRMPYYFEIR